MDPRRMLVEVNNYAVSLNKHLNNKLLLCFREFSGAGAIECQWAGYIAESFGLGSETKLQRFQFFILLPAFGLCFFH